MHAPLQAKAFIVCSQCGSLRRHIVEASCGVCSSEEGENQVCICCEWVVLFRREGLYMYIELGVHLLRVGGTVWTRGLVYVYRTRGGLTSRFPCLVQSLICHVHIPTLHSRSSVRRCGIWFCTREAMRGGARTTMHV